MPPEVTFWLINYEQFKFMNIKRGSRGKSFSSREREFKMEIIIPGEIIYIEEEEEEEKKNLYLKT